MVRIWRASNKCEGQAHNKARDLLWGSVTPVRCPTYPLRSPQRVGSSPTQILYSPTIKIKVNSLTWVAQRAGNTNFLWSFTRLETLKRCLDVYEFEAPIVTSTQNLDVTPKLKAREINESGDGAQGWSSQPYTEFSVKDLGRVRFNVCDRERGRSKCSFSLSSHVLFELNVCVLLLERGMR
jgi:hypothetical protein